MRLVSWNVNGLRAVMKKGFADAFAELDADVFALQETKLQAGQIEMDLPGYREYWSYAERKGYSGTAVFCKEEPIRVLHGLGVEALDDEGRILALEFEKFWFVDVYTPNAQAELARLDHRMEWDDAFRAFCKGLEQGILPAGVGIERAGAGDGHIDVADLPRTEPDERTDPKPVVMCGDFNVAHEEIDLKNPKTNRFNPGFSDEERGKMTQLLSSGFLDSFRTLYPDKTDAYSWWSYRAQSRARNVGWRIDYFIVSERLRSRIENADILAEVMGSDHCPVLLELKEEEK